MFYNFLIFVSNISVFFGIFFVVASFIGFIRYNDFYTKLHSINMFNIYGVSFILFAMAILTFNPIIFFEMIFVIILNSICSISVVSALLRSSILNGVQYDAKTREEVLKIRDEEKKKLEEEEKQFTTNKNDNNNDYQSRTKSGLEEKEKKEERKKKKKKKKDIEEVRNIPSVSTGRDKTLIESEEDKGRKEAEEIRQKVAEQKRILRKKIEQARREAFITRKKDEIERVEKEIHDLLSKHGITEEDLKDDEDDYSEGSTETSAKQGN